MGKQKKKKNITESINDIKNKQTNKQNKTKHVDKETKTCQKKKYIYRSRCCIYFNNLKYHIEIA